MRQAHKYLLWACGSATIIVSVCGANDEKLRMSTIKIPLVGMPTQRNIDAYTNIGKDQMFIGVLFQVLTNPVTGKKTLFASKRPGLEAESTPAAGQSGSAISSDGLVTVWSGRTVAYSGSTTNVGDLGSILAIYAINKVRINEENFYMISAGGFGYFLPVNATAVSNTFTADTSNTSKVLTSVSSTSGLYVGQNVSGTGIAALSRIQSIDSASQITLTIAATATGTGVTITREDVAKIIDTDFPNIIGGFAEMDGYLFVMDSTNQKRVYNSDLNSVTSWGAASYLTAGMRPDSSVSVLRIKNLLAVFGTESIEFYANAGNATGSPLRRIGEAFIGFGASSNSSFQTTIAQMGDLVCFAARGLGRTPGIWVFNNSFTPTKISTPVIDNIIYHTGDLGAPTNSGIDVFTFGGCTYCHIVLGGSTGYDLLYDFNTGVWSNSGLPNGASNCTRLSNNTKTIDTTAASGKIYNLDQATPVYQDDSVAYTMTIRTSKLNLGTDKRKFINSVRLIADEQSSGTATLEASDDDYATWATLGTFDMTKHEKRINRCGSHKGGRAYRLTHSANTAFRAESLEIDYEIGTS